MAGKLGGAWRGVLENPIGLLVVTTGTIVLLAAGRAAIGTLVGDTVRMVTYYGIIGGVVAGFGMAVTRAAFGMGAARPLADVLALVIDHDDWEDLVRPGVYLYFVIAAGLGGLYPRIAWVALGGSVWAELPTSLAVGLGYGGIIGVVGVLASAIGAFELEATLRELGSYLASYLVFGVLLGLVVGAFRLVGG